MKPIRSFLLLVLLVVISISASRAQDYVVTSRGDVLRGKVRVMNFGPDRKVQITDESKKKKFIPLLEVAEVMSENEIYHPVKGPFGYTFMKLKKLGYLSVYNFQQQNQTSYDGVFLRKKDGSGMEAPNLNFKRAIRNFLQECPEVSEKVDNGTYGRKELTQIVDEYNDCIGRKSTPAQAAATPAPAGATEPWTSLLKKVESMEFDGKSDVIDMINEASGKISRGEKVPNFLLEGLKASLKDRSVDAELQAALATVK